MMDDSFCFGFSFSFFIVTTVTNIGSFQYLFRDIAGRLLRPVALSTLESSEYSPQHVSATRSTFKYYFVLSRIIVINRFLLRKE